MDAPVPFRIGIVAEPFYGDLAHAGHDSQAEHDIFGVGDLETDRGQRRVGRAHDVGNDEHGASTHRTLEQPPKFRRRLVWIRPVIGWPDFLFCWCAYKSELLDTSDVVWARPVKMRVRNFLFIQFDQDALLEGLSDQELFFCPPAALAHAITIFLWW